MSLTRASPRRRNTPSRAPPAELPREAAVAFDDPAPDGLHATVEGRVRLQDPARLAPTHAVPFGRIEVLYVERGGHAGVLVLPLDPQEADPAAVDDPAPA